MGKTYCRKYIAELVHLGAPARFYFTRKELREVSKLDKSIRLEDCGEFLTVEEFMGLYRLRRSTAYDIIRRGEVKSMRVGRRILIPRVALEAQIKDVLDEG